MLLSPGTKLYAIWLGLFLILTAPYLWVKSMFMDGMIYSAIAHNLYLGKGSFWDLQFTQTLYPQFNEHPPLAMWIQSKFYFLLGDSWVVDKLFSLFTYLVIALLIRAIWQQLGFKKELAWGPLLLWSFIPVVFWASGNNVLENTMSIFLLSAVLFLFHYEKSNNYGWVILAGIMLLLGFLTKGFVALYPLSFPFFSYLILKNKRFSQMLFTSLLLLLSALLPLLLLYFFSDAAHTSLSAYLDKQVVRSISSIQTVDSRFFILKRFLSELIPPILIGLLLFLFTRKSYRKIDSLQKRNALLLIAVALAGVLPIMVSMKQSGFYILTVYPLIALAGGILLNSSFESIFRQMNTSLLRRRVTLFLSGAVLLTGILFVVSYFGTPGKDKDKVTPLPEFITAIGNDKMISVCPSMTADWGLHAYFQRFGSISLDANPEFRHDFLLIDHSICDLPEDPIFTPVPNISDRFFLFKREIQN